jgi:hypothetical protein
MHSLTFRALKEASRSVDCLNMLCQQMRNISMERNAHHRARRVSKCIAGRAEIRE